MAALVHKDSCPAVKTELDLWVVPMTQMAIARKYPVEFRPVATVTGSAPLIEFLIPAQADNYFDLDETHLNIKMKCKLFRTNAGAKTEVKIDDDGRKLFSPVNNMLHSIFQRVDLEMNGKLVTATSQHYPYRSYLEVLLNYDRNAMNTHLVDSGWLKDTDFGVSEKRCKLIDDNGNVNLYGRLRLDIMNQGRLMLGGIEMKLTLQAHKPSFYFVTSTSEYSVEVEFTHVALFLTCARLTSPILTAHEKALSSSTAKYPITRTEIKQFIVPAGAGNVPLDTVYQGQLPRRMFMVMLENEAENGSFNTNPFKFSHFNVGYLSCLINGEAFPAIPLTPDFSTRNVKREYHELLRSLDQMTTRPLLTITPDEFANGYTIFAWNLAPDYADGCANHWSIVKRGNCRMELRFDSPLTKVITILFLAEFDNVIECDKDRNIITDF